MPEIRETKGNGALELVREYFEAHPDTELNQADHFLTWLALNGYIIAPLKGELH